MSIQASCASSCGNFRSIRWRRAASCWRAAPATTNGMRLSICFTGRRKLGHAKNPVDALFETVRFAGFTRESYEACLGNEQLFKNIKTIAKRRPAISA